MSDGHDRQWLLAWGGMIAASLVTLVVAVALARSLLHTGKEMPRLNDVVVHHDEPITAPRRTGERTGEIQAGVAGVVKAGEITSDVALPSMAFALDEGQSLDPRLPAGPFEGTFTVVFDPGMVRSAMFGARLQNGSLIIRRGEDILMSTAAEAEPRDILMSIPVNVPGVLQELTYEFRTAGGPPYALRALWQPVGSHVALPLPATGAPLLASTALQGQALVQDLNCVVCHTSGNARLQAQLAVSPGPVLGDIGARADRSWLATWLADPHAMKPGTRMPSLLHGDIGADAAIDLSHYMASLGGPIDRDDTPINSDLIATGESAYHSIGCFACHGPAGARVTGEILRAAYHPIGDLTIKTNPAQLASFLLDPLATRPSGHMPAQQLTPLEADAIAAYLFSLGDGALATSDEINPRRAERGEMIFAAIGCTQCHELGPNRTAVQPMVAAPPLESLTGALDRGCLSTTRTAGIPDYHLTETERALIADFIDSMSERRCDDVPLESMALTVSRLNCTACHEAYAATGPEPTILRHFQTHGEADLGDEGRFPPDLTDVGSRVNQQWLRRVLEEDARARPWMAARMPDYGQAVEGLTSDFAAAAGVGQSSDREPEFTQQSAEAGRLLVGDAGLNCIQCHDIAGRASTGTPGPDLAFATERLRYDGFNRWLHDPSNVRPGTRMPSFFVGGYSGVRDIVEGRAQDQIDAIWNYLSLGELLPLPDGLVDPAGMELQVADRPVVFRTFMAAAGVRAIAVGFPEQVHYAFDADRCRVAAAWSGQFLNAKAAWASRGGSETNPQQVQWSGTDGGQIMAASSEGEHEAPRFRGYMFDEAGRPTFLYVVSTSGGPVEVSDRLTPAAVGESRLIRTIEMNGPPGASVAFHPRGQSLKQRPVGATDRGDGTFEFELDERGAATIVAEVKW